MTLRKLLERLDTVLTVGGFPFTCFSSMLTIIWLSFSDILGFWDAVLPFPAIFFLGAALLLALGTYAIFRRALAPVDPMAYSIVFDRRWTVISLYAALGVALVTPLPASVMFFVVRWLGNMRRGFFLALLPQGQVAPEKIYAKVLD